MCRKERTINFLSNIFFPLFSFRFLQITIVHDDPLIIIVMIHMVNERPAH